MLAGAVRGFPVYSEFDRIELISIDFGGCELPRFGPLPRLMLPMPLLSGEIGNEI